MSAFVKIRILFYLGLILTYSQVSAFSATSSYSAGNVALRHLVDSNTQAAAQFSQLRKLADRSLCEHPNPIPRIISAGYIKSAPEKIQTVASLMDMVKIEALAWSWVVTEDERYSSKAREFIKSWAKVNQPDGNPINETKFEPLIEAYDLIRLTYSKDDRDFIDSWLHNKATVLWFTPKGKKENWQSHRLKIVGLIAMTIGDTDLWRVVQEEFKDHIQNNFDDNGESQDFKRRDALHYHLYSVLPLLTLACVAQSEGLSLFAYRADSGASLKLAVEFILPYALGNKRHYEFINSQVKYDRARANAGEMEFQPHQWNPKRAINVFAEAGCMDFSYNNMAAILAGQPNKQFINWRTVLNSALVPQQTR